MLTCQKLRGERCVFGIVSESIAVLCSHWAEDQAVLCPRSFGEYCPFCQVFSSRLYGFCVGRVPVLQEVLSEPVILELPESLLRKVLGWEISVIPSALAFVPAQGKLVRALRKSGRSPWSDVEVSDVSVSRSFSDQELLLAVIRLFRLPADQTLSMDSLIDDLRVAVRGRAALVFAKMHPSARTADVG